jgi:c-di-GMP-binding flagellar brake protein YcgR
MNLTGIYRKVSANEEQGGILIENMSMTGIGFSTAGSHSMKPGDQVLLQFVLMDENRTGMEIVATVVRVGETMIGCSFQSLSPEQEEALASFFMGIL